MIKIFEYIIVFLLLTGFFFWKFWFCRKPMRDIPEQDVIVSPANGKVVKIIEYEGDEKIQIDKGYIGKIKTWTSDVSDKVKIVVIMMTPLDVHVQRASYDAKVINQRYSQGKFLDAVKSAGELKATLENEHNEILFETDQGWRYKVIQIAGFLARRIHDYTEIGKEYKKGDEIGFIDLGSQVVLIVPDGVDLLVKEGDKVIDGESVIGVRH